MAHRPPLVCCVRRSRVLPLLTLTRLRDGLGLRPGRREPERAGQQQCPQDSCVRHERALHHIGHSFGPAVGSDGGLYGNRRRSREGAISRRKGEGRI